MCPVSAVSRELSKRQSVTRITEFKHLRDGASEDEIVYGIPAGGGRSVLSIPRRENTEIIGSTRNLRRLRNSFSWEIGTYKYYNMDQVVARHDFVAVCAILSRVEATVSVEPVDSDLWPPHG